MPHKRAKRSIRLEETAKKGVNLPPSSSSSVYDDTPRSASRIINGWATQKAFRESGRVTSEDTGERKPKPKAKVQDKGKTSTSTSTSTSDKDRVTAPTKGKEKEKAFSAPKILPHESLGEYNRRVESLLRPEVNKAIRDAQNLKAAEESKAWKEKKERKKRAKIEKLVKEGKLDSAALDELDKKEKEKGKRKRDDDDDEEGGGEKGNKKERPMKEFASMPGPKRLNDIVQAPPTLPHLRKSQNKGQKQSIHTALGKDSGKNPLNAGQRRILEEERERVVKLYREMKESGRVGKGVEASKEA